MITQGSVVAVRHEFLAVVLADPELLDVAFAEVIASWEAEPPQPPDRTLVATSDPRHPRHRPWRPGPEKQCWRSWVRAFPRSRVARSPPQQMVTGRFSEQPDDRVQAVPNENDKGGGGLPKRMSLHHTYNSASAAGNVDDRLISTSRGARRPWGDHPEPRPASWPPRAIDGTARLH
jgi:hypothetical protein